MIIYHVSAAAAHAMRIEDDYQTFVLGNELPRGLPRLADYLRKRKRQRLARHRARRGIGKRRG